MLPSLGRGRGRGRGRGNSKDICEPLRCPVGKSEFQSPAICGDKSLEFCTQQEKERKTGNKKEIQTTVDPEDIITFQIKRKLSIKTNEGSLGKRIKLISNCFPIKVPSGIVFHYDVSVINIQRNPESEENSALLDVGINRDKKYRCLSTKKNREIIKLMLDTNSIFENSFAAYDGQKNLYTRNPLQADFPIKCKVVLPNENDNFQDPQGNNPEIFEVEIKPVIKKETESCSITLDSIHALFEEKTTIVSQEAIMALETILRHGPCLQFTPIGRSFFYPPNPENLHPLGGGLEIWFGYHQSIRLGQWGPMVNLNHTATTFYKKGPVLCYIAELMNTDVRELHRRPHFANTDIRKISNKLKNRKIEVSHLRYRRKYRILKLVKENANRLEFQIKENGRTITKTVATYFRERYNKILEFPNLPCLQVYPENKKTYLPIEVCELLEGQHSKTTLEGKQKSEMIKFTAHSPSKRFSEINQIKNKININNDRIVQHFGLEVSQEPLSLEGRVLEPPTIQYNGQTIKPKDGSWNMRQIQFLCGATIESWVLLSLTDLDILSLEGFAKNLVKVGREKGILMNHPEIIRITDISKCVLKDLFSDILKKYEAKLAVVIISENDKFLYGRIKQAAETIIGLATQCIKKGNINPTKCTTQLLTNLCMKINSKMGGKNNSLMYGEIPTILKKPVIIIGADVNHPSLSKTLKPSLAACVGSLDMKLSKYAVSIRAQNNIDERKQTIEIIQDLKNMVSDLLRAFYKHTNRKKPEKIIFFRDGVSEGQFEKVREHEVRSIREACRSLEAEYEPGITFIVVQKRHHVRFMPEDQRDGVGNMRNMPPGTVVDTVVTHPVNRNFYLCSHLGLKGTSRPAHYTVLEDDNDFTVDDLHKLSYQLCHTYARCTRSISIPVPVAYADLAAYRARQHLEAGLENLTSRSDSSAGDEQPLSQSVFEALKVIKELQDAMYFV